MRQFDDPIFAGLLEAAPDAMVCVDESGRIVLVNAQAERLFGYPREELAGQPVEILVPDAIRAGHPDLRAGYAADPQPRQMGAGLDLSARRRDGTTFPAEISLSAIDTDQGILVSAAVRDVTEQRQAALAQARLASIIESSHDAVFSLDLDGLVTTWNPGAERLYGYTSAEVVGRHADLLLPEQQRSDVHKILAALSQGEKVEEYQAERVRKDGTAIAVMVTLAPIADKAGTITGLSAVVRDISLQQRADARFRGLLEAAPDATVCVDESGRIVLVNAQAERLFGYPREELAGQPVEILVPDAIRAGHPDLRAGYAADPQPRQMGAGLDLSARRRDGTTFPAEISLSAIDTDQGILVSAAVRDVTEQRRADARFRGLLEAAPDATVCVDESGRIVLVNAQAERLFGYPREELAGQPVEILVPDAIRAGHPDLRAGYAADPQPRQMGAGLDLSARRRDGTTFPAEISLSAIDTDQGILVSAAVRDVTEQRQARDDLRRTNQNLQSFSYSLAHDLRTPLRSLAGFSTALIEDYADTLGEDGRGYAQRIEAASEHMGRILDDLLHLSAISRAKISLQQVDLGAEVATIAAGLQRQDPGRQVRFTIQQPAWALADVVLIREVLRDLLDNAWKFTGGRDNASIEFGMTPAGARVCCYVRDNGAGFDPAFVHKLFQPFQRLHTTRGFAGTGIGLASVRQVVDRHNGRTWAEGTVGGGATFFFTLQAAEPVRPPDE